MPKETQLSTPTNTQHGNNTANWYVTAQQDLVLERIFLFNAFLRRLKASWDYPVIIAVFFSATSLMEGMIIFDY
jgi:hypothetical protein